MDKDTLNILRDPENGHPLQLIETDGTTSRKIGCLLNPDTGRRYRIIKGIPILLNKENVVGSNRKYQKFYDRIAFTYDLVNKVYYFFRHGINYGSEETHRRHILEEIEISPADKVLEVGIGPGTNLRVLPQSAKYYGVDISLGMLDTCRRNLKRWGLHSELFQAMAENLPFMDNVFDAVYHIGGFNYFGSRKKTIDEMIRVAKPGTKIVIVDETVKSEKAAYGKIPIVSRFYSNRESTFSSPLDLIPENMSEIKVKEIYDGVLYCLSFRVP